MEKYTRIKNIGKGNMGACYLMKHNEDGTHYVMKQIDLANMSRKERKQALNEARVLSSLKHPNIINYVDSFLARRSDHLCIVMEYAEAGDLASKLKVSRGHLRENVILDWFIQICLAVNAIHQKHILHRDIKTQNIFLTSQGIIKVGDFGVARELQNTFDQAHTFVGTPYYLSPELVQEKPYDTRSDVWALGVVLYEMMTLKHPFNASDMKSLMTKILRVHFEPPPSFYSQDLRMFVHKILVRDPRQRLLLGQILSAPIVRKRLGQWVSGAAGAPSAYSEQMLKHKLLPGYVKMSSDGDASHEEVGVGLKRGDSEVSKRIDSAIETERQSNREAIKREFSDFKNPTPRSSLPRVMASQQSMLPPAHGVQRKMHDPFMAQNEALRRNMHYKPPNPHPVGNRSDMPDSLRQRELLKERELQGMMGHGHGHGHNHHNINLRNPHLVRVPRVPHHHMNSGLSAPPSPATPRMPGVGQPLAKISSSRAQPQLSQIPRPEKLPYKPQPHNFSNLPTPSGMPKRPLAPVNIR